MLLARADSNQEVIEKEEVDSIAFEITYKEVPH